MTADSHLEEYATQVLMWLAHNPSEVAHNSSIIFFELVRLIGSEATLKLCFAFGGKTLEIPNSEEVLVAASAASAVVSLSRGESEEKVAAALGEEAVKIAKLALPMVSELRRELARASKTVDRRLAALERGQSPSA